MRWGALAVGFVVGVALALTLPPREAFEHGCLFVSCLALGAFWRECWTTGGAACESERDAGRDGNNGAGEQ